LHAHIWPSIILQALIYSIILFFFSHQQETPFAPVALKNDPGHEGTNKSNATVDINFDQIIYLILPVLS